MVFLIGSLVGCSQSSFNSNNDNDIQTIQLAYVNNTINLDGFMLDEFLINYQNEYGKSLKVILTAFDNEVDLLVELQTNRTKYDMVFAKDFLLNELARQGFLVNFDKEPITGGGNYTYLENYSDYESDFLKKYWNRVFFTNKGLFNQVVGVDFSWMGVVYRPNEDIREDHSVLEHLVWHENRQLLPYQSNPQLALLQYQWQKNLSKGTFTEGYLLNVTEPVYYARYWKEQILSVDDEDASSFQTFLQPLDSALELNQLNQSNYAFMTNSDYLKMIANLSSEEKLQYQFSFSKEISIIGIHGFALLKETNKEASQLVINAMLKPDNIIRHGLSQYRGLFISRGPLQDFFASLAIDPEDPIYDLSFFLKRGIFDSTLYHFHWQDDNRWKYIYPQQEIFEGGYGLFETVLQYPKLIQIWNQENLEDAPSYIIWIIVGAGFLILSIGSIGFYVYVKNKQTNNNEEIKVYRFLKLQKKFQKNPTRYKKEYERLVNLIEKRNRAKK